MCNSALFALTMLFAPLAPRDWNVRDQVPLKDFVIQSHRGAGELEAENTIEAFELSWKLGVIPEADLRATKDGVMVAFHDANFKRLVKGASPGLVKKGIKNLTWDEVSVLDVGSWKGEQFAGRRIPKMIDVFKAMTGRPDRRLYLDIKEIDFKILAKAIQDAKIESQVILASTKYDQIVEWKSLVPLSGTLHWMGGTEEELEARLVELRKKKYEAVTQLQIHVRTTGDEMTPTPAFLKKTGEELRRHGILFQTLPWGSTDSKLYWKLMDLGAASFATDHPRITLDAVRAYYEQKAKP